MNPEEEIQRDIILSKRKANKKRLTSWKRHMELCNSTPLSMKEFAQMVRELKHVRNRAIISTLYLTGSRISEILHPSQLDNRRILKVKDFHEDGNFLIINTRVLKVRKSQLKKNWNLGWKKAYINQEDPNNIPHLLNIQEYWDDMGYKKGQDFEFFKIGYRTFIKYIGKKLNINPHYIRHLRATHLANDYGFSDTDLRGYFGWTSAEMPSKYSTSTSRSIKNKLTTF